MSLDKIFKVRILVISLNGEIRSDSLRHLISNSIFDYEIIRAIDWRSLPCQTSLVESHLHNNLSCAEYAAGLSHVKSRTMQGNEEFTWTVIFEDDAVILDAQIFSTFISQLTLFESTKPFAFHLFPSQYGIFARSKTYKGFLRTIKLPDYAVGYILSNAAVKISSFKLEDQIGEIADFPSYLKRKLVWLATELQLINHPKVNEETTNSSIEAQRENRKLYSKSKARYFYRSHIMHIVFIFFKSISTPISGGDIASPLLRSRIL